MRVNNKYYNKTVNTNIKPKTSNRDEVINCIVQSNYVEWFVTYYRKSPIEKVEDIVQDIYLMLLELPQEEYDELWVQGEYTAILGYVGGMLKNQCRSKDSALVRKYYVYEDKQVVKDDTFWDTVSEKY